MHLDANWLMQLAILTGIGAIGYFIKQTIKKQDTRITGVESECKRIDKDLADLKSDLPFIYVTREDYIRHMNAFENKLDRIYDRLVQGGKNDG